MFDRTRRNFCSRVLLTLSGLLVLGSKLCARAQGTAQLAYPPMKIEGADRLIPGSVLNFSYPTLNDPAVLVRAESGQYFAHSRKCAHLGCTIDFDQARRCLECPCHGGAYDAQSGSVLYGPPTSALESIILQVRSGGEVWAVGKGIGAPTV
jgi:Rieske Fe-S protein